MTKACVQTDHTTISTQIGDGIVEVFLPLPGKPTIVNVYLVNLGDSDWALIDTGTARDESREVFLRALAENNIEKEQVKHLLATHHHPDHFGASEFLASECGTRIYMHPAEREALNRMQSFDPTAMMNHVRSHGIPIPKEPTHAPRPSDAWSEGFKPAPLTDQELEDGEILSLGQRKFQVIHTPGHTEGHCCFLELNSGTLLVGDHLLPKITPHIGVYSGGAQNPLGDFMASQEKIADLKGVSLVGPAHGSVYPDHVRRAHQLIEHHDYRMREMLDFVRNQSANAYEVAQNSFRWVFEGNPEDQRFNRGAAVMETIAHLNLLEVRGALASEDREGIIYFRTT